MSGSTTRLPGPAVGSEEASRTSTEPLLRPAMEPSGPAEFPGAVWVGQVQDQLPQAPTLRLEHSDGYAVARLLVRTGRRPRGFVELPLSGGRLRTQDVVRAIAALPEAAAADQDGVGQPGEHPAFSVVLCTRDRPEALRAALTSLLALDYQSYEVVVVDNASRTDATAQVVAELVAAEPGVTLRLVREPAPGLARARNTGVLAAAHPLVAFTDDDVVVDPAWLQGLAEGFGRPGPRAQAGGAGEVGCVTGVVPSGEVRGLSQLYFERRVWWSHSLTPRTFSLADPPAGEPLFPFRVGLYGTGANFAVRRSALLALGGFDEALGVGSPTGGGEDIDIFVRMLQGGYALAYQPSALIWHRHRSDPAALLVQAKGYGLGLGAWLTTVAIDRRLAASAARRSVRAVRHLWTTTKVDTAPGEPAGGAGRPAGSPIGSQTGSPAVLAEIDSRALRRAELRAVLRGPVALLRARRAGARRRPLLAASPGGDT